MLLTADIGNSSIKFGFFHGKELIYNFCLENSIQISAQDYFLQIRQYIKKQNIYFSNAIICSVVTNLTEIIAESINKFSPKNIYIIDQKSTIDLPVKIAHNVAKNEVGKDRLMTSLAAFKNFGGNLAVVDLGTATTIDVINKKGIYQGGVIFAGINLTLKTLAQSTSLLPKVNFKKQNNIVGKNTIEAINSGIYFGHAIMIESMIKKISIEFGFELKTIVTGGYAEIIQELIPNSIVAQHLVLYGLSYYFQKLTN